jgi:hypothetical protein
VRRGRALLERRWMIVVGGAVGGWEGLCLRLIAVLVG